MVNESLTVSDNRLSYDIERYWPADADPVNFLAYYPRDSYEVLGGPRIILGDLGTDGIPTSLTYTMPDNASDQIDLLVSDYTSLTEANAVNGTVPLVFHHMLSQIRFYVLLDFDHDGAWWDTGNNQPISFKVDVTLSNINTKGTLNISTTSTANEWGGHTWGSPETKGTSTATNIANNDSYFAVDYNTFDLSTFNADDYPLADAAKMLVLPGTYGSSDAPKMTVSISDTDNKVTAVNLSADLVPYTSGGTTINEITWKPGYIYNYYFKIILGKTVWGYFLNPTLEAEQW